jgi:hypothetical protein
MSIILTADAAEHMLKTKKFYTAKNLSVELEVTSKKASGFLFNIRTSAKYNTIETDLPNRTIKLISIMGRKSNLNDLWKLALFPSAAQKNNY